MSDSDASSPSSAKGTVPYKQPTGEDLASFFSKKRKVAKIESDSSEGSSDSDDEDGSDDSSDVSSSSSSSGSSSSSESSTKANMKKQMREHERTKMLNELKFADRTKHFIPDFSYDAAFSDVKAVYDKYKAEKLVEKSVALQQLGLTKAAFLIETGGKLVLPAWAGNNLDGWARQFSTTVSENTDIFLDIHYKYGDIIARFFGGGGSTTAPEIRLLIVILGSMGMFMFNKQMLGPVATPLPTQTWQAPQQQTQWQPPVNSQPVPPPTPLSEPRHDLPGASGMRTFDIKSMLKKTRDSINVNSSARSDVSVSSKYVDATGRMSIDL